MKKHNKQTLILTLTLGLLFYTLGSFAQISNGGEEVLETVYTQLKSWKDIIFNILDVVAVIILFAGVIYVLMKIIHKRQGHEVDLLGDIGTWVIGASFLAAAILILDLFV